MDLDDITFAVVFLTAKIPNDKVHSRSMVPMVPSMFVKKWWLIVGKLSNPNAMLYSTFDGMQSLHGAPR